MFFPNFLFNKVATAWNRLPDSVVNARSVAAFKAGVEQRKNVFFLELLCFLLLHEPQEKNILCLQLDKVFTY